MARDQLNALYRGEIWKPSMQRICRERIDWMCSQARGEQILDLGCSEGMASLLLGREGHQVLGLDIDPAAIEAARKEFAAFPEFVQQNVRFELVTGGRLPAEDASFDTVLMGEILEHQSRPDRLLAEAHRVLRSEGVVVITTPFGVQRSEDHRQTFYLSDFVELVSRFFRLADLRILGKYICYVGHVSGGGPEEKNGAVEARRLLALSEHAFRHAEDAYLERIDRVVSDFEGLKKKVTHLQAVAETRRQEQATVAARLTNAERWHSGSLQLMHEVRGLLDHNGSSGAFSNLAARAERILSTANGQADAAHALDLLAEVVRDLVGSLESQLVGRERELVRLREAQQAELARVQQERRAEGERGRRELKTATEQARSTAEQRVNEKRQKEFGVVHRALKQKEAQLARLERNAAYLRKRLIRHRELLTYFKAELGLKRKEVRYRLGDAFVSALKHPRDFVLLPVRLVRLFVDGLRRSLQRSRRGAQPLLLVAAPVPTAAAALVNTAPPPPAIRAEPPPRPAAPQTKVSTPRPPVTLPPPPCEPETAAPPAEPKFRFQPVVAADRPPRLPVRLATIMDEFTCACFKPEAQLMPVTPDNWRTLFEQERPDALFVESAWQGNGGAWQSQLTRAQHIPNSPLLTLVDWCKANHIPTVFWNKEDPPNFEHFIYVAKQFEHIFTTDEDCIPRYRAQVPHTRVFALPFAAQPAVHNPIGSRSPRYGQLCFAGTYYNKRHADRRKDVELLLRPALARGLTIFDRMADYTKSDNYHFPPEYRPAICGALPYAEMLDAYKRFDVFLNVNSVTESPTMFSRRVFELLACGTPVISTYALGIERLLGPDTVALVRSPEESARWMDELLGDPEIAERMVLRGQRRIFGEHTYEHRLRTVLEKVGIAIPPPTKRVSVVTCTNRPQFIHLVVANYQRQAWPDKELVLILHGDDFNLADVQQRLSAVPNARVLRAPATWTLGECLNYGIDEAQYEYWTKFDDDNFYAEHFLTDLMHAFTYADASVVGKCSYYAYLEGLRCLALRFPNQEHRYVSFLSGSAMIIKREVFKTVRFPAQCVGEDTKFLKDCTDQGLKLYSTDRFNYVVRRAASTDEHTWKIGTDEYLQKCQVVAQTDDYRPRVVV